MNVRLTDIGLPLRSKIHKTPLIAAFVLHASGALTVHTKQHLHTGESPYFSAGDGGELLQIGDIPLVLSICADFSQPAHAAAAALAGARLYAASVLVSDAGYPTESATLQSYAEAHHMAVLMANHGGSTGGWSAAGGSAFWDENGEMVASTSGPGDQLLVVSRSNGKWQGSAMTVDIAE
jgi:predicted amidohydrolase